MLIDRPRFIAGICGEPQDQPPERHEETEAARARSSSGLSARPLCCNKLLAYPFRQRYRRSHASNPIGQKFVGRFSIP
jgi:hypothetical protein